MSNFSCWFYHVKPLDSLHLALAEASGASFFLTTDDRLLHSAKKMDLRVTILNPVPWLIEVTENDWRSY